MNDKAKRGPGEEVATANKAQPHGVVTAGGKEYQVVHPGARWYFQHRDRCRMANGILSEEKYLDGLLRNVLVGSYSLDDFTLGELDELQRQLESFLEAH